MISRALATFIFAVVAARGFCGDGVELTLRTEKAIYRIGERITFQLLFKNTSTEVIKLFPDPEIYTPTAVEISSKQPPDKVEHIEIAERSMDWVEWSKDAIILRPNGVHIREIKVDFSKHLPADWKPYLLPEWNQENATMPYLIFAGGSALRLPGFGKYNIVAKYEFQSDHPVVEYIRGEPKLWFGRLRSDSVTLELKQ